MGLIPLHMLKETPRLVATLPVLILCSVVEYCFQTEPVPVIHTHIQLPDFIDS